MHGSRVVSGLTVVFAGIAVLFAAFGVVSNLVFLAVAALFGAAAYLTWYHASGRLAERVYRGVEQRAAAGTDAGAREGGGGFGAGPREEWVPPREGQRAATAGGSRDAGRASGGAGTAGKAPSPADYRALGLEPGADESRVREAYRSKVKEVHPDAEDGDEEAFKRVTAAYERLAGEGG